MTDEKPKNPKRKKFKDTKVLVTIAINAGMTQGEIAKLCRVSQSIVSGWKGGNYRASDEQMAPLLKRYGSRLNRTTSRIYLVGSVVPPQGDFAQRTYSREEFDGTDWPPKLVRVEGPVLIRHLFWQYECEHRRERAELIKVPIARWILHRQPTGRFVLVDQRRRILHGEAEGRWRSSMLQIDFRPVPHPWLDTKDDAARWLSRIEEPMDGAALVSFVDAYVKNPATLHNPHDEMTLPVLVRKMLVEAGVEIEGVGYAGGQESE